MRIKISGLKPPCASKESSLKALNKPKMESIRFLFDSSIIGSERPKEGISKYIVDS